MNSREFEFHKDGKFDFDNMNAGLIVVEGILRDIDIILRDYDIGEEKKAYLIAKKQKIADFFKKYKAIFSKERVLMQFNNLNYKQNLDHHEKQRLQILRNIILKTMNSTSRKYNVDIPYYEYMYANNEAGIVEFYQQFYEELLQCFDIEDEIHKDIVIPIWREYLNSIESEFEQGDEFAYLLHSSNGFINLPGSENYQEKKTDITDTKHKEAFISTSLITDKEMETGSSNVGVLIAMKEGTILSAFPSDCGTKETDMRKVTNIKVMENGICITIGYGSLTHEIPFSKLGTPKHIEASAIQASINNTGEMLNAGKWIIPIYTEVVVDKTDFELGGVFFKTTGCDINLKDYIIAKQMEMYYGKKLRIINQSVYREQNGLKPYTEQEEDRFIQQLQFYCNESNYKMFEENPVLYRNLIQLYYKEVVCGTNFKENVKMQIETVFIKLIEHLNSVIQEKHLQDTNQVLLNEIIGLDLDSKSFPPTRYSPQFAWGSCVVTQEDIGREFAMDLPVELKDKVITLLESADIKLEQRGDL